MLFTFDPFALMGGLWIMIIVFAIVFWVVALLIAIWVYKDAKKRDMNAAFMSLFLASL